MKAGGAPDFHRSQQNQTVQFAKPDHLISTVLSRGFWSLFISCGNTFFATSLGNRLFQARLA
jgi:hypothetical protein